jgi:hypothetical protein
LEDRLAPATFTVVNALDAGAGSLRQAILDANATFGAHDTINFEIGAGVQTISPTTALPIITDPVTIDGTAPGTFPTQQIELNGAGAGSTSTGLIISAGDSTVRGLVINRFGGSGIELRTNGRNHIEGCIIGLDATGNVDLGNGVFGIGINNIPDNVIGGTTPGAGNVVSGNRQRGIEIQGAGAERNLVQGNFVGTNAAGDAPVRNDNGGIRIGFAHRNTIGGTDPATRNVISGNGSNNVIIQTVTTLTAVENVIIGNYIGTDATGTVDLGNTGSGISITGRVTGTRVGGLTPGERNVISGNINGVLVNASIGFSGVQILGNYIGLDATGNSPLGNSHGVALSFGDDIVVAGNVISGNSANGVLISGGNSRVEGNRIGVNAAGDALGNGRDGVSVGAAGPVNVVIGGTAQGTGNIIAYNSGHGVRVSHQDASGIAIMGNSIFANAGLGIELGGDGVTPNDAGDVDGGQNLKQNFPVLTDVVATTAGGTTITGTLNSTANTSFRLEFFANVASDPSGFGEGQRYLGFTTVTTPTTEISPAGGYVVSFSVTFPEVISSGEFITATATDPGNNTSEFSQGLMSIFLNAPPLANAGEDQGAYEGAIVLFDGAGSTDPDGDPLTYFWDFGDGATGTGPTPTHIYSIPGSYIVTLTVEDGRGGASSDSLTATILKTAPSHIYVDDDWANTAPDADPDGDGPATRFGFDAFASIQPALDQVAIGGVVSVAAGQYTEQLVVTRDVAIEGAGADQTLLLGEIGKRSLTVMASTSAVTVFGVTIQNGLVDEGGGVLNEGTLWLTHVVVRDTAASNGGGIANRGTLRISDCIIRDNLALADGGGIWNEGELIVESSTVFGNSTTGNGGGIWNGGDLTLENSTLSGNRADEAGGGLFQLFLAEVNHSTIADNQSPVGAGIYGAGGAIAIRSTIVAKNRALADTPGLDLDGFGFFNTGHNLIGRILVLPHLFDFNLDPTAPLGSLHESPDPRLARLADNGGSTPTHALRFGSPAIDQGDPAGALPSDQRGQMRIVDGNYDGVSAIDIGAFEAPAALAGGISVRPLTGRVKVVGGQGGSSGNQPPTSPFFPEPHRYTAELFVSIPGPMLGPITFEAWRDGVVVAHQEISQNPIGPTYVTYENAIPGVDEIEVWAKPAALGGIPVYDTDLIFWNPSELVAVPSLSRAADSHPILAPTMAPQTFVAGLHGAANGQALPGSEFTFHQFRADVDEYAIAGKSITDASGHAALSLTRPKPAVQELVAATIWQGQRLFANAPIQWVTAPPQLTLTTTRPTEPDSPQIHVAARLTRDLDPANQFADDTFNPPVPRHTLRVTALGPLGLETFDVETNDFGVAEFDVLDFPGFPEPVFVIGDLVTHLEGEFPNETPHTVHFSASTFVFDTVEVTIPVPFQELPTREVVLGGLASAPNRAYVDAKVEVNGAPAPGVRVLFDIVSGPNAGDRHAAVSDTSGIARMSFLNQNEFDFGDGDGDPGIDVVSIKLDGTTEPMGTAEVHWYPSRVSGPFSALAEWLLPGGLWKGPSPPWVHVDMEGDRGYDPNTPTTNPLKVRFIDPVGIAGGLTSFREITSADNLPAPPHGFRAGVSLPDQKARYYEIQSTVQTALDIPILVFIHKDDFPEGSDKIFHAKDGVWQELVTIDGGWIAAADSAVDFLLHLGPDLVSNLVQAGKSLAQFADSELSDYWVGITDSLSPFALFLPDLAPRGGADTYLATTNRLLQAAAERGVLSNDTGNFPLTARVSAGPLHGALHLAADGSFDYTPDPGYIGEDSFTYWPFDGVYYGDPTTVTLFVTAEPFSPSLSLENTSIHESDTATLVGSFTSPVLSGAHAVDIDWEGDGAFDQTIALPPGVVTFGASRTYLDDGPNPGNDTPFEDYAVAVRISDDFGNSAQAAATLRVLNLAPAALDDSASTNEDQAVAIKVLANDSDPAGALDPLEIVSVANGAKGRAAIDDKGTPDTMDDEVLYTPNPGETGSDSFSYAVSDGDDGSAIATVTVQIRNLVDISGRVFDDQDNDGAYESGDGDVGIGGVTVELFDETTGSLIAAQTTAADGGYFFDVNLPAGTYKVIAAQPAGFLDGRETAGNLGGAVNNSQDSNHISGIQVGDPGTNADAVDYLFAEIRPSQIMGLVWSDTDDDGEVDFGETAIPGAGIELSGLDDRGNAVSRSGVTDANGIYSFLDLRPSAASGYSIRELQPLGYADGKDVLGTVNGTIVGDASINDMFAGVVFPRPASLGENYNFGERQPSEGGVEQGQTATIGFWQNKNGQSLIRSLNGGPAATQLGDWLATTFPNLYGDLAGKTNGDTAEFYKSLFARGAKTSLGGPPNAAAQVMATALAVYVTNQSLAGTTAASYGFLVTETGVGSRTFNVADNGDAFDLANNSLVTVLDLLLAANRHSRNGLLYDLDGDGDANDSEETTFRKMANDLFSAINEAGDLA